MPCFCRALQECNTWHQRCHTKSPSSWHSESKHGRCRNEPVQRGEMASSPGWACKYFCLNSDIYLKMIKAARLSIITNKAAVPIYPSICSLVLYFTSHFEHRLHPPICICPHEQHLTHRKYTLVLRFYLFVLCKGVYFSITPLCSFMWRSKCLRTEKSFKFLLSQFKVVFVVFL